MISPVLITCSNVCEDKCKLEIGASHCSVENNYNFIPVGALSGLKVKLRLRVTRC